MFWFQQTRPQIMSVLFDGYIILIHWNTLRKHAYSNILNLTTKKWKFSEKNSRRGGSNEYPQSMFLSRTKKNNVYPCKFQFYYIKVGFKGVNIILACFRDVFILKMLSCYHSNLNFPTVIWSKVFKNFIGILFWFQQRPQIMWVLFDGYIILIHWNTLRKHAYSNILKFHHLKMKIFR